MIVHRAAQRGVQLRGFRQLLQLRAVPRRRRQREALGLVFEDLLVRELPYDAALAGLELATIRLERGDTPEVITLAHRMEKVFRAFKIKREAMAALLLFCEAARQKQATVELAHQTAKIIQAAQQPNKRPPLPTEEEYGWEREE